MIEEIARIYGYDNIEEARYSTVNIQTKIDNTYQKFVDEFREIFVGLGFYEVITNSMVGSRQKDWIEDEGGLIKIRNPLSEEMMWMRKTLVENVLRVMEYNKNRGQENVLAFNISYIIQH